MAISEKRESLNKEKKDTSLFKGEPFVPQSTGKLWAKGDKAYELTKIPKERREKIWEKLAKGTNLHFDTKEAEKMHREIKDFPKKSKEKYGIKDERERKDMLKMIEKSLGK